MDWKHIATIALGAGCLVASVLLPATAPVLSPIGGALLLMSNPVRAVKGAPRLLEDAREMKKR